MIELETTNIQGARICVVGVGGGGGNAINNMIAKGLSNVDFIAANTDIQALQNNLAPHKIQLGKTSTRGLGAGADPNVGYKAVEESADEIRQMLTGMDMVFITAGMGGGTGTGAAPVVAKIAHELGALVVAIVTKPFKWEASRRMQVAERGIEELRKNVDALIVIPNQRLLSIIDKHTSMREAYMRVDDVLYNATRGISDIISGAGYINVDFADVRTIMKNTGDALMGTGIAKGEHRAIEAAQAAISSPLLDGLSINGAQGVLVNITASQDLTMFEVSDAVSAIEQATGSDVNLIHGVVFDESMGDTLMVTVVATGFSAHASATTVGSNSERLQNPPSQSMHQGSSGQPHVSHPLFLQHQPPQRTIPSRSPSGIQELQKYDEPAYKRRSAGDFAHSVRINRFIDNNTQDHDPSKQQISEQHPSKPAFLRRIMD
ncbi:MAG: cell division protein FtsZ [Bacteroidota bacterium]|nr:cell division protein FtsZ [Candidatus Kapabacteria bacterium]MDW8221210.1 cell division protein FtsZ [Bacteroidota bacterium]